MKKAVVLLSGGIDSAVTAWIARKEDHREIYALTFGYGQAHGTKEIECAIQLGIILGVKRHLVFDVPLVAIGGSSLLGEGEIPTEGPTDEIPSTWVPQRNAIFLAIAFGYAEVVGADLVYIGLNVVDYSGYPDCRPVFVEAMQKALNLASKQFVEEGRGIGIVSPLSRMPKAEIILRGQDLGIPFEHTWTCYRGKEKSCGVCDSCRIRLEGFKAAGLVDLISYDIEGICGQCLEGSDMPECPLDGEAINSCLRRQGIDPCL